jgi:5-methylthioadenosine/S-adenosylhomocysteine deaminase
MKNDWLVAHGTLITLDPSRRIIEDGAILIEGNTIRAVGNYEEFAGLSNDKRVLDASGKIIFPGLINTHTHIFQTLLRGIGQDLPVWDWFSTALDTTVSHLTPEDCYISAKLGAIEAVKSGTTCILDYNYPHPVPKLADETIRAFQEVGIRGIVARGIIDTGEAHARIVNETESELADCERLIREYDGLDDGMLHIWIAPYTIFSASAEAFKLAKKMADRFNTRLTVHAATPTTIEAAQDLFGMDDLTFEENIGFLGPDVLAVHCTTGMSSSILELLRARGVSISHNPASNAYLGEGIAPVREMIAHGIPVCLGTDGPSSNNNQDMIATLKLTALMQKADALDPTVITAEEVVEMATITAARCIGLDHMIGSIEPGKRADLMIIDPWLPNTIALHDPVASLVYSCTQENVHTVIINGRIVMENRRLKTVEEGATLMQAQHAAEALLERAALSSFRRRPWRSIIYPEKPSPSAE